MSHISTYSNTIVKQCISPEMSAQIVALISAFTHLRLSVAAIKESRLHHVTGAQAYATTAVR